MTRSSALSDASHAADDGASGDALGCMRKDTACLCEIDTSERLGAFQACDRKLRAPLRSSGAVALRAGAKTNKARAALQGRSRSASAPYGRECCWGRLTLDRVTVVSGWRRLRRAEYR